MGRSSLAGGNDCEGILVELKNKVELLETSVKSCSRRLKEFQNKNRISLLEHDKKIKKLTAKLQSLRGKLKEGKSKFKGLERKVEGVLVNSADEAEDTENENPLERQKSSGQKKQRRKRAVEKGEVNADDQEPCNEESAEQVCKLCEKGFESREDLQIHSLHLCPVSYAHGCPACPEYFPTVSILMDHLRSHESESGETVEGGDKLGEPEPAVVSSTEGSVESYECGTCGRVFGYRPAFHRHLNFVHPEAAPHRCDKCDVVFISLTGLRQHEGQPEHKQEQGMVRVKRCHRCSFSTVRGDNFARHRRMCSGRELRKKCGNCDSFFPNLTALYAHCRVQHAQLYSARCSICGKGFRKKNLSIHEARHLKPTLHRCTKCKYYFFKRAELAEHEQFCGHSAPALALPSAESDPENLPLQIPKCRATTANTQLARKFKKKALKRRKPSKRASSLTSFPSSGLFTCKTCRKQFGLKSSLTRHEKTHSNSKVILAPAQKYGCKFCKKAFSKWFDFTEHVKTHSESHGVTKTLPPLSRGKPGLKKWKCLHCEKEFSGPETMHSHFIYTHAWRKPHECKSCQRSFCSSDGLKRHSKAHTDFHDPDYQEDEYE